MKGIVYTTLILGAILIFLFVYGADHTDESEAIGGNVCFDTYCFDVWVPQTDQEIQQGLMYVKHLKEDQGMLFVFDVEANYTFWMKNTLIPLEMIWINSDLEVVDISYAVPCESDPCRIYYPREHAKYVLEIGQNSSREYIVKIGDTVTID